MLPETKDVDDKEEDLRDEKAREIGELKGEVEFEFFDLASNRFLVYTVDRAELAKASRSVAKLLDENLTEAKPVDRKDMEREDDINKSWSNSTDNRIRRAIADGFSDTHSIYQSLADFGGCWRRCCRQAARVWWRLPQRIAYLLAIISPHRN